MCDKKKFVKKLLVKKNCWLKTIDDQKSFCKKKLCQTIQLYMKSRSWGNNARSNQMRATAALPQVNSTLAH